MISRRFEDITFSDVQALLNNQVAEGKTIEYKQDVPSNADSDKVKFLAGVSAFANTIGGDFIIGVEAKDGIPTSLPGANFNSADDEILKLEQMLQNGLEPRLPSVNIKDIASPTGANFILIRVNRSWVAPHKVKANEKFYGRNSKGKYPLDVSELRSAFMLSEQLTDRIRNFRAERVRKIKASDEMPVELSDGGKMVLHLIPLSAFSTEIEVEVINTPELTSRLRTIGSNGWSPLFNLDGFLNFSSSGRTLNQNISYTQIFRNGTIESVVSIDDLFGEKIIPSQYYELEIMSCFESYLRIYLRYDLEMPVYFFLSFVNVKNYALMVVNHHSWGGRKLDRTDLILSEKAMTSYNDNHTEFLRPLFDIVWNAFGYKRSLNFDENGKWINI